MPRAHTPLLALLLLSVFLSLARTTHAHSRLTNPKPYTRKTCKGCERCRKLQKGVRGANSVRRPSVVWRRGQSVPIRWLKNNHEGGFVRFSLIPVRWMFAPWAHRRYAFYYGCWEQNRHRCRNRPCGSDRDGVAFRRRITIPSVIPNGVYVFSYMWFGGLSESRRTGRYGCYTSCSYIRIRGGRKITKMFRPIFRAGKTGRHSTRPNGKCFTSAKSEWDCRWGCPKRKPFKDIPQIFKRGRRPKALTPSDYRW